MIIFVIIIPVMLINMIIIMFNILDRAFASFLCDPGHHHDHHHHTTTMIAMTISVILIMVIINIIFVILDRIFIGSLDLLHSKSGFVHKYQRQSSHS